MKSRKITLPLTEGDVRSLHTGDMLLISGEIVTGRDRIHKFLFHEKPSKEDIPFRLEGAVLYHTGPIVKKTDTGFEIIAIGPTTSSRVQMYEPWVIGQYGLRGVIGKGGMDKETLLTLKTYGCVYLHTIGGAASYLSDRVRAVKGSFLLEEFGMAEAMWLIEVEDFPAFVTMDSHGKSLHEEIEKLSLENLLKLLG